MFLFLVAVLVLFLSAPPAGPFGLRNGPRFLSTPQRGMLLYCIIRTMAQTLCYDLARAEKAKDGKKSSFPSIIRFSGHGSDVGLTTLNWKYEL